jgi:hypothetical protein
MAQPNGLAALQLRQLEVQPMVAERGFGGPGTANPLIGLQGAA